MPTDQGIVGKLEVSGPLVQRCSPGVASGDIGTDGLLHDQASRVCKVVKDCILIISPLAHHGLGPGITYTKQTHHDWK